jgi:hypothetical protein
MAQESEQVVYQVGISEESIFFVDETKVNLWDLAGCKLGRIIRCLGNPAEAIKVVGGDVHYDHLAGLDAEAA